MDIQLPDEHSVRTEIGRLSRELGFLRSLLNILRRKTEYEETAGAIRRLTEQAAEEGHSDVAETVRPRGHAATVAKNV